MYLVLSIEMQKNVYRAKHCIFIYIFTYILYIYRVENQNMEYFIAQFCHIFLSVNTKNLYPILGWRFIVLIQANVSSHTNYLSTQEVKRQRIADLLRDGVETKRIAPTRGHCEHYVQC